MIAFRDGRVQELGLDLIVHVNEDGLTRGISPVTHGSEIHTDVMKTQALRQALDRHRFDAAIGGARRDEETSRAKERVFSLRNAHHRWDPKRQRPEPWRLYNTRKRRGESFRVFPLSNWTELDIWLYIEQEQIPIVPLYFAADRPVVRRDGMLIMLDDGRLPLRAGRAARAPLGPLPDSRLLSPDRGRRKHGDHASRDHPRDARGDDIRAARPRHRPGRLGVHGTQEAGGLLLMTVHVSPDAVGLDRFLSAHRSKDVLRFITCGSVDDGKSTLIGRLLHDTKQLFDDQLAALKRDSRKHGTQGGEIDFALLVDGLSAEREQGITIDVAYRFFSTDQRTFIVADTPGHEQYTRNMATGASTADLAVLLVDASQGLSRQTRRHSLILSMLGIRQVILAINKMDLVGWSEERYATIMEQYALFAAGARLRQRRRRAALRPERRQRRAARRRRTVVRRLHPAAATRGGSPSGQRERGAVSLSGAVGEPAERVVPRLCRPRQRRNRVDRRPGPRRALRRRGQRRPHRHV